MSASTCQPDMEVDPDGITDVPFNWAPRLEGETILTSTFLLPDGLTEESSSNTDTTATIFVSGAVCGTLYRITNRITDTGGRSWDKTYRVIGREQ